MLEGSRRNQMRQAQRQAAQIAAVLEGTVLEVNKQILSNNHEQIQTNFQLFQLPCEALKNLV
jgi:hypothetical protein